MRDTDDLRPDPDRLLEKVKAEQAKTTRGNLKIFFGYVAGVGKTYAMLEAARRQASAGVEVVSGYVEPHGRAETEVLAEGLEALPALVVEYRGIQLKEFDLDAALARHPHLILVDELAHSNTPGARHPKRWQDVEELLEAGISVYTTMNVQHLESLNDVIAQITGVQVRETVPDAVFDEADSVEVVDLPPRELFQRLNEGKVYVPAQAARAMESFFKPPNIGALREITLRRTADRVHAHLETTRLAAAGPRQTWAVLETLLVCVGPSPTSAKVIRTSKRMASSLNARWIAVAVATSPGKDLDDPREEGLQENIRLAERLGAETATLSGDDIAEEIMSYARSQNVTKIVIGKTAMPRWRRMLKGGVVEDLLDRSGDMDVYVVQGGEEVGGTAQGVPTRKIAWAGYGWALFAIVVAGAVAWAFQDLGLAEANKAIIFLLAIALVAARFGRGPGFLATVLGVLAFDFFFVPPFLTFAVEDAQYAITFLIMLVVALIISTLAGRLRQQVGAARARERRLEALYRLSRELSASAGPHQLAVTAQREIATMLSTEVIIYLPGDEKGLEPVVANAGGRMATAREAAVATWAYDHGHLAGAGTDTLPEAGLLHLPMITPQGVAGVLSVAPLPGEPLLSPRNRQLLETLATQIGIAVERDELVGETRRVLLEIDRERLRSSLLSSVSHDLRTPLAVIAGTSSTLLELHKAGDTEKQRELLEVIVLEANRLSRLVENLLSMTRLDAGVIRVEKQWSPVEEVVGSALGRLRKELEGRPMTIALPPDLPLVPLDGVLIEQVLVNLLENSVRYSPADAGLEIAARPEDSGVLVQVADRGEGLAPGEEERIFDKLYRGSASVGNPERGTGLGLAIARAIVNAHGGRIWAENRAGGGTAVSFTLPVEGSPPDIDHADEAELAS